MNLVNLNVQELNALNARGASPAHGEPPAPPCARSRLYAAFFVAATVVAGTLALIDGLGTQGY